jgi:hypothetical protein
MTPVRQIPLGGSPRKVRRAEGAVFDLVGTRFTWKVKGDDTGFAFSIYEQELAPGQGVPHHCHAYPEAFNVLAGAVHFLRMTDVGEERVGGRRDDHRPHQCGARFLQPV